jgi:hypothetical protein
VDENNKEDCLVHDETFDGTTAGGSVMRSGSGSREEKRCLLRGSSSLNRYQRKALEGR